MTDTSKTVTFPPELYDTYERIHACMIIWYYTHEQILNNATELRAG